MPAALSYPGVYIEEMPSGVRTITGVATSITAFIGRASFGPKNEPVIINSFGDFERRFGGLGVDYPMSYSIRDFYLNGGSQAIIVRLFKDPDTATDAHTSITIDSLLLEAKYPGEWGKKLRVALDPEVSQEVRTKLGLATTDPLFHLTVSYGSSRETFLNLTIENTPRRIDRVLAAESGLLRWKGDWPPTVAPNMTKLATAVTALAALNVTKAVKPPVQANIAAATTAYLDAKSELEDPVLNAENALAAVKLADPVVQADVTLAQAALDSAIKALIGSNGKPLDNAKDYKGSRADKTGLYALEKADLFNLLCIPPDTRDGDTDSVVYHEAMIYCTERRAMLIVDPPAAWSANADQAAAKAVSGLSSLGLSGPAARNAALYFPRVLQPDPWRDGQVDTFVPCGIIAGIMARTDTTRGVWKAPAGLDAAINGIHGVQAALTDLENGMLNPLGINCLRAFPVNGRVVWGARTLRGADQLADEYKYIPVRRTALFIEESLYRGTQWVVFEPNDEPLWSQVRLNLGAFMHNLFRQGAFQGKTPAEAYFVKCDKETTTQNDINLGIVNVVVGFAPLKPAEFVVIKLQQIAGQVQA
jgi:uncharacterized protein